LISCKKTNASSNGNHGPNSIATNSAVHAGVPKTRPTGLADATAAETTLSKEDQSTMDKAEMSPATNKGQVDRNV
jgi:hypothetical protein